MLDDTRCCIPAATHVPINRRHHRDHGSGGPSDVHHPSLAPPRYVSLTAFGYYEAVNQAGSSECNAIKTPPASTPWSTRW